MAYEIPADVIEAVAETLEDAKTARDRKMRLELFAGLYLYGQLVHKKTGVILRALKQAGVQEDEIFDSLHLYASKDFCHHHLIEEVIESRTIH